MTTIQSCILAVLFLLCACLVPTASFPMFFGLAAVSLTWALYSVAITWGRLQVRADGLVWGA